MSRIHAAYTRLTSYLQLYERVPQHISDAPSWASRQYDAALTFVAAKSVVCVWRFIADALDKCPSHAKHT